MKKIFPLLFFLCTLSSISFSQGLSEIQLSAGWNSTRPRINSNAQFILPDDKVVIMDLDHNSGESFNYGILLSWQIKEDKPWSVKTGLFWTNMNFSIWSNYLDNNTGYFLNFKNNIRQIDLPILLGYKKTISSFEIGFDFGIIKTIWLDSEVNLNTTYQAPSSNPEFKQITENSDGFVPFGKKYSFFVSPLLQWNFSRASGISLQPFYRFQVGSKRSLLYRTHTGSIKQFGLNLGYNIKF